MPTFFVLFAIYMNCPSFYISKEYICHKTTMKRLFHVCLSSHDEVLFRNAEDFKRATNCLALSLHHQDATSLAHSFMSDHIHLVVRTDDVRLFVHRFRVSYVKYFNRKYKRSGMIGQRHYYINELDGIQHIKTAVSYTLRNALHHGVTSTPFEYPYSSILAYYKDEWQRGETALNSMSSKDSVSQPNNRICRRYLPAHAIIPRHYCIDTSGIITPESYIEISYIRSLYGSFRNFLFQMNRISSEEWQRDQEIDNVTSAPITLELIESQTSKNISILLANEKGRRYEHSLTDIDLCQIIDNKYVPYYHKPSYWHLSPSEKRYIALKLKENYHISDKQVSRCLSI